MKAFGPWTGAPRVSERHESFYIGPDPPTQFFNHQLTFSLTKLLTYSLIKFEFNIICKNLKQSLFFVHNDSYQQITSGFLIKLNQELNCGQLKNAYAEAERFKEEAKGEKGVTGSNTARGLLFWPAIIGTYMNSNEAIQAADSRKVHLMNIMRDKDCSGSDSLG